MEGAGVFRGRGEDGNMRCLNALNPQLLRDLDLPLLSLEVKKNTKTKLLQPEGLGADVRLGKGRAGSPLAGGGAVRKLRTEQEEQAGWWRPGAQVGGDDDVRQVRQVGCLLWPGLPQLGEQAPEGDIRGGGDRAFREPAEV